jgi:DNA-binding NtrC family response regulator
MQSTINVLLVEDDAGDARLLQETLSEITSPYVDVTPVRRLDEASQLLQQRCFDVVLLDLKLPDGSRAETLRRIRDYAENTPIVVVTGLDDEVVALWAAQEGAQDYLVKGRLDSDQLLTSMRYAIETQSRQHEHAQFPPSR